jgi:hypothetical protein
MIYARQVGPTNRLRQRLKQPLKKNKPHAIIGQHAEWDTEMRGGKRDGIQPELRLRTRR